MPGYQSEQMWRVYLCGFEWLPWAVHQKPATNPSWSALPWQHKKIWPLQKPEKLI